MACPQNLMIEALLKKNAEELEKWSKNSVFYDNQMIQDEILILSSSQEKRVASSSQEETLNEKVCTL